jgi:hypothetical protein
MAESNYIFGDEDRRKFARLVAESWEDVELRSRYEREPRALLGQYGIAYPEGVPTPQLPLKPDGEFDVADLESAAGVNAPGTAACPSSIGCDPGICYCQGICFQDTR